MALPSLPSVAALSCSISNTHSREGVRVKEERPDEDEINELAAKMVEANKAKLAAASVVPMPPQRQPLGGGQHNILSYFNRTSNRVPATQAQQQAVEQQEEKPVEEKPPIDIASQKGKFGCVTMGEEHIPYILRGEDKYCAVRMVEVKLLAKYLNYLNSDIYSCTCIRSYYITEAEARLLTEINVKHNELRYGREAFTTKDLVVRLTDASEFYNFLDLCYTKLLNPTTSGRSSKERCGFIRINNDSVVPYTIKEGKQFVPLFYFEGETDNLKQKADKLESWDLAYLKFCCKVQGIRSELFASETCSVISLADIKSYFPAGTVFDEYWPPEVVDSQLLLQKSGGAMDRRGGPASWIKAPPGGSSVGTPPSAPPPPLPGKEATLPPPPPPPSCAQVVNGWPSAALAAAAQTRYQPSPQPQRVGPPVSSIHNAIHGTSNVTRTYTRVQSLPQPYYPSVNPRSGHTTLPMATPNSHIVHQTQPPPLVRVTTANPTLGTPAYSSPNMSVVPHSNALPNMGGIMQPYIQYPTHNNNNNAPSNQNKFPPPLIPVLNGNNQRYYHQPNSEVIDLSSPPQSPQRSIIVNGKQQQVPHDDSGMWKNLIPILDSPPRQSNHFPFKMQKALVNGKMVPCINAKPYVYSELLMTVNDLIEYFFPQVSLSKCKEVLQNVLQVNLYSGNLQQKTILRDNNKCKTLIEVLPLIQLKDVVTYMPQMKYVLERHSGATEVPAKRQRIS